MKLDINSLAQIVGYLKRKSSLMIFEKYANMKYKYGNIHFWCRGYYLDTVGKQLKEDKISDQLTIEQIDPFKG